MFKWSLEASWAATIDGQASIFLSTEEIRRSVEVKIHRAEAALARASKLELSNDFTSNGSVRSLHKKKNLVSRQNAKFRKKNKAELLAGT